MNSGNRPTATAQGTLDRRPLVHLLVYVLEKKLSGSLILSEQKPPSDRDPTASGAESPERGREVIVVFAEGSPTKVQTPTLAAAGADAQRLEALLALPDRTAFAFYEGHDAIAGVVPSPADPLPWVWKGLRKKPPRDHVKAALARVGEHSIKLLDADLSRFKFDPNEERALTWLRSGPVRMNELAARSSMPPEQAELLVYALLITKRAAPSNGAVSPSPSAPIVRVAPVTPSAPILPSLSPSPSVIPVAAVPAALEGRNHEILARAAIIDTEDYFQMLGVPRESTADAIKAAYLELVKTWHPDRLPSGLASAREACSRVFARLTEAQHTLLDAELRARYMRLLSEGGATPKDQEAIVTVVEAATCFQKAEFFLKRADYAQAESFATRALELDPNQADYHALAAWLDAVKPNVTDTQLKAIIGRLTQAIELNEKCEKAHYYRGMVYKRTVNKMAAVRDFQRAAELNPRNVDALREVRLHEMRASKPPARKTDPGSFNTSGATRPSQAPKAPSNETGKGGLFGRLFKK